MQKKTQHRKRSEGKKGRQRWTEERNAIRPRINSFFNSDKWHSLKEGLQRGEISQRSGLKNIASPRGDEYDLLRGFRTLRANGEI